MACSTTFVVRGNRVPGGVTLTCPWPSGMTVSVFVWIVPRFANTAVTVGLALVTVNVSGLCAIPLTAVAQNAGDLPGAGTAVSPPRYHRDNAMTRDRLRWFQR